MSDCKESRFSLAMKRWPLWLLIALGLLVATLAVSVIGTTLMSKADSKTFFELFERQNENSMKMLVAATRESIISEDIPLLESVLNDFRIDNEDLLLIRVYNEDEKPLVRWNGATDESEPYVLRRNVDLQGEKFGRVEVGWKSDWIARRVDSYAGRLRYFLVTVLVLLAGIIIFLIHVLVVRPVRDIDLRLKREVSTGPVSAGPRIRSMELHRLSDSVDRFHKLLRQKEEATRELVESESLKAAMLSSSLDGIITIDEHSRIVEFNSASEKMFGYSREEAINQDIVDLIVPPKWKVAYKRRVNRYLAGDGRQLFGSRVEIYARRRSGSLFPVEVAVTPFELENVTYFTASVKDITERRQSEEAMRRAREEAENANEAKSRFLATMSHEIRTPLNALININEFLLDTALDNKQKNLVETSRNSGKVLSDIVDSILDFSKIESGNLELEEVGFSVVSAVSMVTGILAVPAHEKGIGFEVSLDPAIPDQMLGDATRLRQVLFNLVGNAIKFTNKGQVKVTVSSEDGQTDQEQVSIRFDIEDTGIGISTHDQGLLFKEFTQVGLDRQGEMLGGTGLGLAISRKLIELMGGEIFVGSVPQQGSHFWFIVPMKPIPERKFETQPPGHDSANLDVHPATKGPGESEKNILVVEDSQTNQLVIKFMLENAGLNCSIVDSGEQALEALANEEFQLVFMDIGLPGIDGIETARKIRALDTPTASIPIIALTAYAFMEDKQRCLDAGMTDYVRKPIERDQLLTAIRGQYA